MNPIRQFRNLIDAESIEPSLTWGLRMAIATTIPVIWGIATGHLAMAEWIALTADCIGWIELKGTRGQRFRVLIAGAFLTTVFTIVGSLTGFSNLLSIGLMLIVAFIAGLFKNLGERGGGLSLCLYVTFLIANAYPVQGMEFDERIIAVLIGGIWNTILGMATTFFIPQQMPYRRTIAIIWRATGSLIETILKGWDGTRVRSTHREIYDAERAIRNALDSSFAFHEKAVDQLKNKDGSEYQLAQVRKAAALVSAHIVTISEELEHLKLQEVNEDLRLRLATALKSLKLAVARVGIFALSRRFEDELLVKNAVEEMGSKFSLLGDFKEVDSYHFTRTIHSIVHLGLRCQKLIARSVVLLSDITEQNIFRSYSLLKTVYVLHPKHWVRSLRLLFSFDSHTTRYAARTALAAGLGMALYKIFDLEHGYWLPLTVIIIMQPYFTATFRKAIDRLIGTIAGGVGGGLILMVPGVLHIKEAMLFISAVGMIHFFRTQYRVSSFFITLNLVLLFSVSHELNKDIILLRALFTLGGAIIAVLAGFALLPTWDKTYLPRYTAIALERNWDYFRNTFSSNTTGFNQTTWTRFKRLAEVSNSNAFDSFNRAMAEPGGLKNAYTNYYQLITHNMRVTRELNNFHLEQETKSDTSNLKPLNEKTERLLHACKAIFDELLITTQLLSDKSILPTKQFELPKLLPNMNTAQNLYLERLLKELQLLHQDFKTLAKEPPSKTN